MDTDIALPGSTGIGLQPQLQALNVLSPSNANRQCPQVFSPTSSTSSSPSRSPSRKVQHSRDSSVVDRAQYFESLAFQGKNLERKANDAALKRAMLGREEAESETRRYRDEARSLRKQLEDVASKEKKGDERFRALQDNYSRAKDSHMHERTLWEKEIRRAKKEAWKSQSQVVKIQEELKGARSAVKIALADLESERERSAAREQEAFAARYEIVGVQEQLANMTEKVKLVEQERDALRTIAKNEEVARIAAEGKLPLPVEEKEDDEFASPKRKRGRTSLLDIVSSAASEEEIEELRWNLKLERQRAESAFDHLDFVKLECHFGRCSCRLAEKGAQSFVHLQASASQPDKINIKEEDSLIDFAKEENEEVDLYSILPHKNAAMDEQPMPLMDLPIFDAEEGTFRLVAMTSPQPSPKATSPSRQAALPVAHAHHRTPSCEPPTFAQISESNASLTALITETANISILTDDSSGTVLRHNVSRHGSNAEEAPRYEEVPEPQYEASPVSTSVNLELDIDIDIEPAPQSAPSPPARHQVQPSQPLHSTHMYHTISTTTRIPLAPPTPSPQKPTAPSLLPALPIFSNISQPPFSSSAPAYIGDNNSAISTAEAFAPTMSREEALARIRERRGRARSAAMGTLTPRKQMVEGGGLIKRDISAPAGVAGAGLVGQMGSRSVGRVGAGGPGASRSVSRGRLDGHS